MTEHRAPEGRKGRIADRPASALSTALRAIGKLTVAAGFLALVITGFWLYLAGAPAWVPVVIAVAIVSVFVRGWIGGAFNRRV